MAQHHGQQRLLLGLLDEGDILSTRSTVVAGGATETCGRVGQELVGQFLIALGMVAEKNRVWRFAGSILTICFSAWMKPRSSI